MSSRPRRASRPTTQQSKPEPVDEQPVDEQPETPEPVGEQGPELVTPPPACRVPKCRRPKWIGDICREHYAGGIAP